jgi:cytidylate kinase
VIKVLQIAIDGPAGSGKSTISKIIANRLDINYLDTGAMYRMCTLKALNEDVDLNDQSAIIKCIDKIDIIIKKNRFYLDGNDVSDEIRVERVSKNVSKVAAVKEVREKMVSIQQQIASKTDVIMDGRDIGTHVLPNSNNKFYLNATVEERAKRRYDELNKKGESVDFIEIKKSIIERDKYDMNRNYAPLIKAKDAIEVDTTHLSIEEVVDYIIERVCDKND